ncbi:phospholipase [Flavobacterium sediminis]|uniref:Phospholipase n=1 Tax=Flavobacterium sediminis TaxID=2201181 RepID=A0A2U8QXN2_9FLAO|nr:patatin-like phospholipase family protein [Flavobacterium sediminis]AWM14868.1 phospholipase [Flavobacterium sediminis]
MKKNITLVLSGGGARGIAHIGVIEELLQAGYIISSISGTSMGALVGGIYAVNRLSEFKEWLYKVNKQRIFQLIDFSFSSQGLVKGERIFREMKAFIPDANIEDLSVNYTATAFDIANYREVVFRQGSLFNAIRASISIPTVLTPVVMGNAVLVDGGVANNVPINNAIRSENDLLVAVHVNADVPDSKISLAHEKDLKALHLVAEHDLHPTGKERTKKFNYFNLVNNTIVTMTNHISSMMMDQTPPDVLIEISRTSCGVFEFYRAKELVEIGRQAFHSQAEKIEKLATTK